MSAVTSNNKESLFQKMKKRTNTTNSSMSSEEERCRNGNNDCHHSSDEQSEAENEYITRRSNRTRRTIKPDHDTWVEHFAVTECVREEGKLVVRPYFESSRSRNRVWDEPPTGASTIHHATSHARQMAEKQLNDYLGTNISDSSTKKNGAIRRIRNFFSKKNNKANDQDSNTIQAMREYSMPGAFEIPDRDRGVQTAIAMSLLEQYQQNNESDLLRDADINNGADISVNRNDQDDLQIAKALSLSLMYSNPNHITSTST